MEVTESTNSNPSPTGKGRDLLIFQLRVFYTMKYEGNQNMPRIARAFELVNNDKVVLYDDNPLRARVEGRDTYYTNLSKNTCTCPDKNHNLSKDQLCKHLSAHKFTHELKSGQIDLEGVKA